MSDGAEWMMVKIDEKMARRQGVPTQVPVPKAEFEGLAEKGLQMESLKKWISAFLAMAPSSWRGQNAALASRYDAFIGKVDMWNRAQAAFAKNDMKSAISTLKMIANIDKEDHASKMNLGSALAATSDHAGAMKHFADVRATFEGEADYHVAVGHVHMALQDNQAAIGEMVLALEAKADCKPALDALKALGVLLAVYEDPKDASSLTYVRTDSLLEYLQGVWDAEPRTAAYYGDQLVYHESERRYPVVLAAADRIIAAGGDGKDLERARLAKIAALRAMGKKDEALREAQAYAAKSPDSPAAQVELAQSFGAMGKSDEALVAIEKALALDPGNLMALDLRFWPVERGDIALIQEAIPPLMKFAEEHAKVPGAWRSVARAKLAVGSSEEALELFAKAVSLAESDDDLRAEYWSELAKQMKFDAVVADAAKIADMPKRDWKLRWNEAEAYAGLGKKMEANAAFTAINHDESLLLDIRKRAKRAAEKLGAK